MHAHTAMYCPVTHNCPLGSKMKISIVIHHHHLIVLSHTYRHAQIPESKQHLQHLATQSFDLGSHPSHSERKKCDSHLPSLVYCLFSKTNLTRSMGFLKKTTTKKQVVQSQHLLYMLLQLHSVHACTSFLLTHSVLFTWHSAFFFFAV